MSILRILFFAASLPVLSLSVPSFTCQAAEGSDAPLAVFLTLANDGTRTKNYPSFLKHTFLNQNPNARVLELTYQLNEDPSEEAEREATRYVERESHELLSGTQSKIRFLFVLTHATCGTQRTHLVGLGSLYNGNWDTRLDRVLGAYKRRFAPEAKIIFNACAVAGGEDDEARSRLQAFVDVMEIQSGQILAPTTSAVTPTLFDPTSKWFEASLASPYLRQLVRLGNLNKAKLFEVQNGKIESESDQVLDLKTIKGLIESDSKCADALKP